MIRVSLALREAIIEGLKGARLEKTLSKEALALVEVAKTRDNKNGDYASNIAFLLSKSLKKPPMLIANDVVQNIATNTGLIEDVFVAKPGFINFKVTKKMLSSFVLLACQKGQNYGRSDQGENRRIQVEFVSVNPTGPLHIGHARGAILGDVLAKLLSFGGFNVQREYYLNDGGTQMEKFGQALKQSYLQTIGATNGENEQASDSYSGEFMDELSKGLIRDLGEDLKEKSAKELDEKIFSYALKKATESIGHTLRRLGIEYDRWFHEKELISSGYFKETMDKLRENGYLYEKDGATWFKTSSFVEGEEDDVLIRSGTGEHTYFATDIAYHRDKLKKRKFERVIHVWGADHHSHIARLKAAISAFKGDPDSVHIVLNQIVRFATKKGEFKFSKRAGNVITIDTLIDEVGKDVCRYLFVERAANSQMVFNIELAKKESKENPVYYIQYAYARICSIIRKAKEQGLSTDSTNFVLQDTEQEFSLAKHIAHFPDLIFDSTKKLEPHHIAYYSYDLARHLQSFYESCRILGNKTKDESLVSESRLKLIQATKVVLENCLNLMGMSRPEVM